MKIDNIECKEVSKKEFFMAVGQLDVIPFSNEKCQVWKLRNGEIIGFANGYNNFKDCYFVTNKFHKEIK